MLDPHADAITELTAEQCWALLRKDMLGRLATTVGQDLDIFPVTYKADGQSLYFRTSSGRKLAATSINANIALEIDGYDGQTAWSVVAKGTAHHLTSPAALDMVTALDVRSWLPDQPRDYVRIDVSAVSGRTFPLDPHVHIPTPITSPSLPGPEGTS